jgi:hypothetical protein
MISKGEEEGERKYLMKAVAPKALGTLNSQIPAISCARPP